MTLGSMKGPDGRGSLTWFINQRGCIIPLCEHKNFKIVSLLPDDNKKL